ncbi:MAG: acyl-CoA dehydrogenase family protein, partial [Halobacteriota archaeon]|nr:acyl-CoA dehydrogenase family protein [Halobacteriota archaeon]
MPEHISIKELEGTEIKMIRRAIRSFVGKEIVPVRQQIDDDKDHEIVSEILEKLMVGGPGFGKMMLSESSEDMMTSPFFIAALEELAAGDSGLAVALACTGWCLAPILFEPYKRPDLIKEFSENIFSEKKLNLGCFSMTEPEGGCDIENPKMEGKKIHTTARLEGDEWVINGTKQWPTNSGVSSLYLTVCTTDPDLGDDGVAMIYVPYPIEGMSFSEFENKAGMAADRNCTIYYDDVRVPERYRIAGPGDDARLLHQNLIFGSLGSAAMSVGTAQNVFDIVTDYAGKRIVAGKPIKEHSINAGILADMAIGIETARAYTLVAAKMFSDPKTYGPRWSDQMLAKARIAKVYSADVAVMVTNKAMELMGSWGYV